MRISVIIPTYNGAETLKKSLKTWINQSIGTDEYEVIVVNNNSTDQTASIVKEMSKNNSCIKYIEELKIGATNARHSGARIAKAEILVFADNDGLFNHECLQEILNVYSNEQKCKAVSCKIDIDWDEKEPEWIVPYRFMLGELNYGNEVKYGYDFYINGGLFSIKKDIFEQLHGFNPDLVREHLIGDGDTGLVKKLWSTKALIGYTPFATMRHLQTVQKHGSKTGIARHFFNIGVSNSYSIYRENDFKICAKIIYYFLFSTMLFTKKILQYNLNRNSSYSTYFSLQQRKGELVFFRYLLNRELKSEICKQNIYNK